MRRLIFAALLLAPAAAHAQRVIWNYPLVATPGQYDRLLLQQTGPGAPYSSVTVGGLLGAGLAGVFSTLNATSATIGNLTLGALNNTPIGNTTPSTGAFSTLTTTGPAYLTGGGTLGGTFSGNPIFSGEPQIGNGNNISVAPWGGGDTISNRFSDVINLKHDCGAKGDGTTDDSTALSQCINDVNNAYAAGKSAVIYVPPGTYLIGFNLGIPFNPGVPGAIVGDGEHKSYIKLGSGFSGDLFSWSEAWMASSWASPFAPGSDKAGPLVEGISVTGSTSSANTQNAFVFLDRDDHVLMRDVDVLFLHGACISIGSVSAQPEAYVRESLFQNVKCWNAGTTTIPAVTISSTTDNSSSDATNELKFDNLDVFASAGAGVVISNPNQWGATRGITFYHLRSEDNAKDALDIGLSTDQGQVQGVHVYDFDAPSVASGYYAAKITTGGSNQPYGISIVGGAIAGSGGGVDVDNARLVDLYLSNIATTGQAITLGSSAGSDIMVRGNGAEYGWSYTIPAAVQLNFALPTLNHALPSSVAVDVQTGTRTATTHYASGTGAFAAGQDNTASGPAAVAEGNANVATGNYAVALGQANTVSANTGFAAGYGNTVSGSSNFAGGYQNTLSGTLSSAPGGFKANDLGRYGWRGQASGAFSSAGDAQFGRMVLRASTTSTTQTELTADGTGAITANIPSLRDNSAATVSVSVVARDVTTAGNSYSYTLPAGLLTRGTGAASTAFAATSTANTGSTGTGSTAVVALAADTAAGGLAVKWTAPNTDTWHVVATVTMTEVQ